MANENSTSSEQAHQSKWPTFAAMIATSIVTMLVLKYSNVYETGHIWFSQTRMWMALMMGMAMIIIMLGFMWGMYKSLATKLVVMGWRARVSSCSCSLSAASRRSRTRPG